MFDITVTYVYYSVVKDYSETTWAVGIAQLPTTRFKVGAKIPRPEVEGFLPPPRTEW